MAEHRLLSLLDVKDRVPGVTSALIGVSGGFRLNHRGEVSLPDGRLTKGGGFGRKASTRRGDSQRAVVAQVEKRHGVVQVFRLFV